MRNSVVATRLALVLSVSSLLALGPIGCGGGGSAPATGTQTQIAPEIQQANDSMENFMKTQKKK